MAKAPSVVWKKLRRWLVRASFLLIASTATLGVLEIVLRTQVAPPFPNVLRTSTIDGLPHQLRPGFSTLYFGHQADINCRGFRGPEVSNKTDGVRRIALVGDSITFGHVAYEDTLAVRLAARLKERGAEAEVLNCGVPGYDAAHVALMLEAQVLDLDPDVIVYVFCFNDAPLSCPTPRAVIPEDHVVDPKAAFPLRSALLELLGRGARAVQRKLGSPSSRGYVAETLANWQEGGAARLRDAVRRMQALCQERQLPILVALSPTMMPAGANPYVEVEDGIRSICVELAIPCVDLREAFAPDDDLGRFQVGLYDSHPNGHANDGMASFLAEALRK